MLLVRLMSVHLFNWGRLERWIRLSRLSIFTIGVFLLSRIISKGGCWGNFKCRKIMRISTRISEPKSLYVLIRQSVLLAPVTFNPHRNNAWTQKDSKLKVDAVLEDNPTQIHPTHVVLCSSQKLNYSKVFHLPDWTAPINRQINFRSVLWWNLSSMWGLR